MGNLADMQSALVDYIDMVGMSDYAQREASETITGSLSSMKAAWTNLVTGFADDSADLDKLIGNLTDSIVGYTDESGKHVKGVLDNLLPAVEKSLGGISKLIEGAAPKIIEILPGLVERVVPSVISAATGMVDAVIKVLPDLLNTVVTALVDNAPDLITAAIGLVQSLIQGIQENYQILVDVAIQIVTQLANGILEMLPQIVQLGLDLIVSLANGIAESLPELIPTIIDVVLQIVDTLTDPETLSQLLDAALTLILALAEGLLSEDSINGIVDSVFLLIDNIVTFLTDPENIMKLVKAAVRLVVAIAGGLISAAGRIKEKAGELIDKFKTKFEETDWVQLGKDIINSVKDGIVAIAEKAGDWGKDLINNFIGGIEEKWENLKNTVSNVAESVKDFLGFSEPKKGPLSNFHTYAPDMMQLFAKGIKDNEHLITDQIGKSFDFGTSIVDSIKTTGTVSTTDTALASEIKGLRNDVKNLKIYLSTGALVGGVTDGIDHALGQKTVANARRRLSASYG